ncbi:hypothetical protein C5B42_02435 [Candidatus Cerribacteria bacterium 'Amazon FNV 2010 28 9']|uniref:CHRD domain-containing protein n=1 Tax=Candidatus Cerribacteria bacterium 'Amazon FNV 2010 28 9' TaxID=2081795 RepID=A0A317JQD0_9BACT|nr:MAG: hypothetical protein C5B42_02435 [Candidatus Cerribacteria bacterium 'Amazon FNV 2010 28 9']
MRKTVFALITTTIAGFALAGCTNPYQVPSPTASPTSTTQTTLAKPFTIQLAAVKNSGQSGTATFEEVNGKVKVTVTITGKKSTVPEPEHIHFGTCAKPGDVIYPLSDVVNGSAITMLPVDIATLSSKGQLILNIHKSVQESNVYMACGALPVEATPTPMATPKTTLKPKATTTPAMKY